jgi:pimeloyl-ACP methyl ester carboxylesterase
MFRYFPGNYMWSLSVLRCLMSGGLLGEIDRAARPLLPYADAPPNGDLEAWHREWLSLGLQLEDRARAELEGGRVMAAHDDFLRAAHYFQWAEAFLVPGDERKLPTILRHLASFRQAMEFSPDGVEIVEVAFEGSSLPAYFVPARGPLPAPAAVFFGGLDSCKEEFFPLVLQLAHRGIACLSIEGPGQGEALKRRGLRTRYDYEVPAGAAADYLGAREDVDPERIAVIGASMGGYYAARAAAREKRFKASVAYGAQYDYRETWLRRLDARPDAPLPAPAHHLFDVFGVQSWEEALEAMRPFTLRVVANEIECPFLIVHGEDDAQIPVSEAISLYDAISSPDKVLRIFTEAEGGAAHCQVDCPEPAHSFIADWLAARLGARQPAVRHRTA